MRRGAVLARLRCALAVLPVERGDPERTIGSLEAARACGLGDLAEVVPISAGAGKDARAALAAAAGAASAQNFDWLLAVSAAETLAPDIFAKTAPALRVHDAVWGGAGLSGSTSAKPEQITRLAAQDLATFFHAALAWWIGPAHFVKPDLALQAIRSTDGSAWYADYMLFLWKRCTAYKTAQRLTLFAEELPPIAEAERRRLIESLEREPVFMPVHHGGSTCLLPYTGLNPIIEREQARGQFFEHEELEFLADRLPRGLRIVDAGANTGNHTVFFAAIMQAESVVPIEPHPRAAAAIRAAVAENRLTNVDLCCLGRALGAREGRLKPIFSAGGGLGAMRFAPDPQGSVPLSSLDKLVGGGVDFLKIDVEGMEMEVLAGAAASIARNRPTIFIEVLDDGVAIFMEWVDSNGYRIEKLFPDKTHCNYFVVPAERPSRRGSR